MNLAEKKSRGLQAQSLLNDDLLKEALREVKFAAHRAFEKARDDEALRRAAYLLEASQSFHRFFVLAATQGAAAAKEIDRELNAGKFVRGVGRLTRNRDELMDDMPWDQTA
jgi:hypothetical protein